MKVRSDSFVDGQPLPEALAFARPDAAARVALSDNRNPHLFWDEVPEGTRSFAILCIDPDAPSQPDDVNHPDREIPVELPRVEFIHWVLIDLPSEVRVVGEGEYSSQVTPRGKAGPFLASGARQGVNDYTQLFASDHDMGGDYYGYDGPCPPWNDALIHRYQFVVHALDIDRLPIEGRFDGHQVQALLQAHTLALASITGTYTLNARLRATRTAV
ncbi:MAG: YbhB/YbcL family Raf kinase inhibitor-like protein [Lautropia sp.]|nr:YbhB/YbcL family Raf kinase inhibitor-like protein [Lautropia sp.]